MDTQNPKIVPAEDNVSLSVSGLSLGANLTLPVNIMSDTTDYYLLTRDKIENLKAGTDSDESTMCGLSLGICLAAAGVLIPLYINGALHTLLIPFLWAAFLALGYSHATSTESGKRSEKSAKRNSTTF